MYRQTRNAPPARHPHHVSLYRGNELIHTFSIPPTDPRFVKADDLAKLARDKAIANFPNHPWSTLTVALYGWDVRISRAGHILPN